MNEQQTLTLHRVRSELQAVPTLEVTPQLIKEMAGKVKTQYKKDSSKEHLFQLSWRKILFRCFLLFTPRFRRYNFLVRVFVVIVRSVNVIEEIFVFIHPFVWTVLPLWSRQNFWCEGLDVFIVNHFLVVFCIPLNLQFFVT